MRWIEDQSGGVAVIVAIMLFLLFGVGALVLDVGNLYWERRQLQNAADAAALAAAQDLVQGAAGETAYATAQEYAAANNSRGAHVLPDEFIVTSEKVTVTARTGDNAGDRLPSILSSVLGVADYATSARAAAAWDREVGGGRTIPITLCQENWDHFTQGGTVLPSGTHIIRFAQGKGLNADEHDADCGNPGVTGNNPYPGGFGFLSRDADCMATTTEDNLFPGIPGNNTNEPHSECSEKELFEMLRGIIDRGETVLIPIFYDWQDQGTNGKFMVVGYAGFTLEGYRMNAASGDKCAPDNTQCHHYKMPSSECPGGRSCLKGTYEYFLALDGLESDNEKDFGAKLLGLVE
jgi:Flp pilus assembly protein TadG